jgi:hypothetical protein|tara:strand:+ start:1326 stop:1547 length:222 start_codon:yes stop_codon:yes gene_type:complete
MKNKYRANYVDSIINDLDNESYVEKDRLEKAIHFLNEASAINKREQDRLIKKAQQEQADENKRLDVELANVEG